MLLRFTKMHGLGNDFVMLDLITQKARIKPEQVRRLSDRRTGIGFDQLLTVETPDDPDMDFRYRIYNADGTEAEQCGNGARCFTRFVRDRGLTPKTEIRLQTNTGDIACKLEKDGNVSVNMGKPVLEPAKIPFVADKLDTEYELALCDAGQGRRVTGTAVSMGNPHFVTRVEDVSTAPVEKLGPVLETHERFPALANIGFMEVVSRDHFRLRVFERGVGETRACGSGACAAMVSGRLLGVLNESVTASLPGGDLTISWRGEGSDVMMSGPASRVYEGRLHL